MYPKICTFPKVLNLLCSSSQVPNTVVRAQALCPGPPRARGPGRGPEKARHNGPGGEEEEGEAGLRMSVFFVSMDIFQ